MALRGGGGRELVVAPNGGGPFADSRARRRLARLDGLLAAEAVEQFMSKRFPTNKRFGLEGLEAEVPMWEAILADAAAGGATDVVIAPMHRGRLTLITRVVGKPFNAAFAELMGRSERAHA